MLRSKLFDGVEEPLDIFNGQAIINKTIEFFTEECETETDFAFPGYVSSYWRVYNERSGRLIKNYSLSQSGASLIINNSVLDMIYEDNGIYYYEIGYVQTGGYEITLRYGQQRVV
jgi:hypothetical protein